MFFKIENLSIFKKAREKIQNVRNIQIKLNFIHLRIVMRWIEKQQQNEK